MKGKERDIKLAEAVRDAFMKEYQHAEAFKGLLRSLDNNTLDKLIYRLNTTEKIHLYRDYNALKAIGQEVMTNSSEKVFEKVCAVDDARTWINNKGKYQDIVFECLYKVFREDERLQALIGE